MELLGDEGQVEARFGPFGDSANLDIDRCTVCAKHTIAQKSFWTHPMEVLCGTGHVQSCFGPFRDSVSVGAR
jgi:hypothetical protein